MRVILTGQYLYTDQTTQIFSPSKTKIFLVLHGSGKKPSAPTPKIKYFRFASKFRPKKKDPTDPHLKRHRLIGSNFIYL